MSIIRPMEHNDLERVVEIWLEANISAHDFVAREYWESHIDFMREILPKAKVWVYCIENQVVAFIGLDRDFIAGLFVAEDYRSQGIGHELIEHIKGVHYEFSIAVYEKNKRAKKFYLREGFLPITLRKDPHTGEKERVMWWHG